ncbi:MAG: tetratricopeptide repeat protein [Terracidiphilus sp.]|jgi:tetratricopeptide (TPR) repeat protein
MKRELSLLPGLLALALLPAFAQTPAPTTGTIHGHVTNPSGASQSVGVVSLSNDGGHTSKYTFQVNAAGDYTGTAAPGTYTVVFRQPDTPPDKMVDSFEGVKVVAGQDTLQDVDMSRKAFIDKLPPEQQKALEEMRKHNSEALKANEIIKSINSDLKIVVQDIKDADTARATALQTLGAGAAKADIDAKEQEIKKAKYTEVEGLMTKDSGAKPDASILWAQLGQAEAGLKKYDEATTAFKKALDVETTAKKPSPDVQGLANSGLGEIYARTGKIQEASDAYDAAAKVNPPRAAFYLKNEAVIFFQTNQPDAQVAAADKAIAADPNSPIPYYLKGNGLVGKTTMDDKTKKLVAPPGCLEAYQKYLQLAPDGPYAADVKGILQGFSQTVDNTYKASKKK